VMGRGTCDGVDKKGTSERKEENRGGVWAAGGQWGKYEPTSLKIEPAGRTREGGSTGEVAKEILR